METGMMKVVFSSIINGTDEEMAAKAENRSFLESVIGKKDSNQSEIRYNQRDDEPEEIKEKLSQEVFASLVNASNCANVQTEIVLDGYLTFTNESALILGILN